MDIWCEAEGFQASFHTNLKDYRILAVPAQDEYGLPYVLSAHGQTARRAPRLLGGHFF